MRVRKPALAAGGNAGEVTRESGMIAARVVAGLYGWTWAGCCEVNKLWVHERWRRRGLGTRLMRAAEAEARALGDPARCAERRGDAVVTLLRSKGHVSDRRSAAEISRTYEAGRPYKKCCYLKG